ncbi:hypothetical protein [Nocardia sp. NBC_01327]|uniref:hypothetical protein n=1 Tax=Nocardia sp. NBC_01327 TaxID=2903593 RepID=UPI002E13CD1D|nr:hypothetical protein OG326_29220 [Nocardia sp. NBC_01327]
MASYGMDRIERGPGWSWIRVDWPWEDELPLDRKYSHRAIPKGFFTAAEDDYAWAVCGTVGEARDDLRQYLSQGCPHEGWEGLVRVLQTGAGAGELMMSYTAQLVPQLGAAPYAPAFVYCVYTVGPDQEAHHAGMKFFEHRRRKLSRRVPPRAVPSPGAAVWVIAR